MGTLKEDELAQTTHGVSDRLKLVVLQQMAEALDDEAAGLNRRAASLEEEEANLGAEIQDHLTEINRLNLRLTAVRSERDSLLGRAQTLRREASQIKEDILDSEEELALESLGAQLTPTQGTARTREAERALAATDEPAPLNPLFFRRTAVEDLLD